MRCLELTEADVFQTPGTLFAHELERLEQLPEM
jgi:hypothetical protein